MQYLAILPACKPCIAHVCTYSHQRYMYVKFCCRASCGAYERASELPISLLQVSTAQTFGQQCIFHAFAAGACVPAGPAFYWLPPSLAALQEAHFAALGTALSALSSDSAICTPLSQLGHCLISKLVQSAPCTCWIIYYPACTDCLTNTWLELQDTENPYNTWRLEHTETALVMSHCKHTCRSTSTVSGAW